METLSRVETQIISFQVMNEVEERREKREERREKGEEKI